MTGETRSRSPFFSLKLPLTMQLRAMTALTAVLKEWCFYLQVERLLETYYIDVSDTHNKLQALSESTADTASFVYFDLTINRNSVIMVRPSHVWCWSLLYYAWS